jgi:hypothetical protein
MTEPDKADDFIADRHADLDAGEFGGAMTDADYYDRISATEKRLCARCRRVLAGEDDEGWYYEIPGGRVYWCDDAPHLVIAI